MGIIKLSSNKFGTKFTCFYILSFVIVIHACLINAVSIFLVGSLVLFSGLLIVNIPKICKNSNTLLGFFFLFTIYFSSCYNFAYFRLSSIIYTTLYVCSSLYFHCKGHKYLNILDFRNIIRFIIYAYFIVLLIQQVQSILGFSDIINLQSDHSSIFKLNSLAWESSNIPLIFIVLSYCYIKIDEHLYSYRKNFSTFFTRNKKICLLILYICFTSGSMSSFLTVPILFLYFLEKKQILNLVFVVLIGFVLVFVISYFDIFDFSRITNLINVLLEFDEDQLVAVDPSSSARIIPYFEYLFSFESITSHTFFGYGLDSAEIRANRIVYAYTGSGLDVDSIKMGITNITSFFYDYGLISAITYLYFLRSMAFKRFKSFEFFIYVTIFSAYSLNHYITWLFINCISFLKVKRIL